MSELKVKCRGILPYREDLRLFYFSVKLNAKKRQVKIGQTFMPRNGGEK